MTTETEIQKLVDEGKSPKEISSILGLNFAVVSRYTANMNVSKSTSSNIPYGLSNKNIKIRMSLGRLLNDMISAGLDRREIARITGLNIREQSRARRRPYTHDWSLSQIYRILDHFSLTIQEIL